MENRFTKTFRREDFTKRFSYAVLFAIAFTIIGWAIPETYYRYVDNRNYLIVDSPISVDKNYYKPCENVILTTSLTALVDMDAVLLNQLVLVDEAGVQHQIPSSLIELQAPIRKSDAHVVSHHFRLPCDLIDGRYYWKGTFTYFVRDSRKVTSFISQTFNVNQLGLPVEVEIHIDESVENL